MASAGPYRLAVGYGRDISDVCESVVDSGDNTFDLTGHSYLTGDLIWISKSDDTGLQFLGDVTETAANTITTRYGANASKGASAKVWTAAKGIQWTRGESGGWEKTRRTGTTLQVSRGGVVYSVNNADGVDVLTFAFEQGLRADYEAWLNFLQSDRSDGASSFTLAYWDWAANEGIAAEVRWAGGDTVFTMQRAGVASGIGRYEIRVFVVGEGTWVEA